VCVFTLGAVPLAGCTEVVEFRTYRWSVTESLPDLNASPSEGVEICEAGTDNCDTTDFLGEAELHVPPNQEVSFTLEKEGYGPILVPDVSDETYGPGGNGLPNVAPFRIFPTEQLEVVAQQVGTTYPWEGGVVGLTLVQGPEGRAGVTFTPVGSTLDMVGEPFYFDAATEQYSLDLEATTARGQGNLLPLILGGFTEVTPGEQEFEFGGTAGDCDRISWAWPVKNEPNRIRVPVRAGYLTYGSIVCD